MSVMSAVVLRKVDFVGRMGVTAVRHLNDGPELMRFRNVILAFEVITLREKGEGLTRTVRSQRFDFYGRVRGHGTRLVPPVIEKESEARPHIGFKNGDFNKAVTDVHEEAIGPRSTSPWSGACPPTCRQSCRLT
jgi:hypothetical protein